MNRGEIFRKGLRDGVPIALGYFAVSFALGIHARNVGLTALQAGLASLLNNASAGEKAAFDLIGAGASVAMVALMTLVTNARYLLMSCALSQKLEPDAPLWQRLIIGFEVTDEVFGASIGYPGRLDPHYSYGLMAVAIPGWSLGTVFGVLMGSILPARLVSALAISLYGMFIAVIIPAGKKDRVVMALIVVSMALSWVVTRFDVLWFVKTQGAKTGLRVILLTVALSALAAWRFPVREEEKP